MFDSVEPWLTETDFPATEDTIVGLLGLMDRARAALVGIVARFDDERRWASAGAPSMISWLRDKGLSGQTAAGLAADAWKLARLPVTARAYRAGTLSTGQIGAISANVPEIDVPVFAQHEAELIPRLSELSVSKTALAMQKWKRYADALASRDPSEERGLYLSRLPDGSGLLRGVLDPHSRVVVATALQAAHSPDVDGEARTPTRRRADALIEVCRVFLTRDGREAKGRSRPELQVVVDVEALVGDPRGGCEHIDGTMLARRRLEQLACDATIQRVVMAGQSIVLDHGRNTRVVPPALFRALVARDRSCRVSGCDRPASWCEAHHVHHWLHGGDTRLENLVLLCSRHHHLAHDPGWQLSVEDSGGVVLKRSNEATPRSRPPP